jgi:hypothetical protein
VQDLYLGLSIMNGPDLQDPYATPAPLGQPEEVDIGALRVATYLDDGISPPTNDVASVVTAAADAVGAAVANLQHTAPTDPRVSEYQVAQTVAGAEILAVGMPDVDALTSSTVAALRRHGLSDPEIQIPGRRPYSPPPRQRQAAALHRAAAAGWLTCGHGPFEI